MKTAKFQTNEEMATLTIGSHIVPNADDLEARDLERLSLFEGVTHVEVSGTGWAYDVVTGEPSIQNGLYTKQEFITLMWDWEAEGPGW